MPKSKIHQAKLSIEHQINFVRQCYKIDLLIVATIIEEQYNALTRIESTIDIASTKKIPVRRCGLFLEFGIFCRCVGSGHHPRNELSKTETYWGATEKRVSHQGTGPPFFLRVQYVIEKWEPRKWEPSCNLPPEFPEKWELSYLGPGGLDSVFYLPCTV